MYISGYRFYKTGKIVTLDEAYEIFLKRKNIKEKCGKKFKEEFGKLCDYLKYIKGNIIY